MSKKKKSKSKKHNRPVAGKVHRSHSNGVMPTTFRNSHTHWVFKTFYLILTIITVLSLAWVVLAKSDFFYGLWHDKGGIGAGIEKFAPQNKYRFDYHLTSREERLRVFAEINKSVHGDGHGLEDIRYNYQKNGRAMSSLLLHEAEVTHLQDVAKLINTLRVFAIVGSLLWLLWVGTMLWKAKPLYSQASQAIAFLTVVVLCFSVVMLLGPEYVFEQFHIWVFPKENQWFFYYQDSLMSTLMLAPTLFKWIAWSWLALALIFYAAISVALIKVSASIEKRRAR